MHRGKTRRRHTRKAGVDFCEDEEAGAANCLDVHRNANLRGMDGNVCVHARFSAACREDRVSAAKAEPDSSEAAVALGSGPGAPLFERLLNDGQRCRVAVPHKPRNEGRHN